jgi:DNA-directed RNA polymerase subunit RPC12/RpoP
LPDQEEEGKDEGEGSVMVKIGSHVKCPKCSRTAHIIWISEDRKTMGIRCSGYHSQLSHGFPKFTPTATPRKPQKNIVFLVEI